jgi:metallophosphoesterase superfamily enzyme
MVLPAFGAYTGGLNVLDRAYDGLFGDLTAWVIGARGVYPIASRNLSPDNSFGSHNGAND